MKGTLFDNIPADPPEELFETIAGSETVRIERIVSKGHASPKGFWYDQEWNEFVLLIRGSAGLKMEGQDEILILSPGDYVDIRAHVKHRVEWTDSIEETIWLAVHY